MSSSPIIVSRDGAFFSVLRKHDDWGIETLDLTSPPRRFWADSQITKPVVEPTVDARKITPLLTPAQLLGGIASGDSWQARSRRSVARLWAHYLVCEDPQRRLDARKVVTLAHQVSLVRHVLENDHLRRVMIADEVGLGKTVEVGLLLSEIFETKPGARVLYLAPARLVNNVAREFERLELGFRRWQAGEADARLNDPRIIASIHRAAHPKRFDSMVATGPWDIIIVDECHHLSDWAVGGGDPVVKFRLVRELAGRLEPTARLLLLSGTPHQGHGPRFENLLRLLRLPAEQEGALRGRVIYRTKDEVS